MSSPLGIIRSRYIKSCNVDTVRHAIIQWEWWNRSYSGPPASKQRNKNDHSKLRLAPLIRLSESSIRSRNDDVTITVESFEFSIRKTQHSSRQAAHHSPQDSTFFSLKIRSPCSFRCWENFNNGALVVNSNAVSSRGKENAAPAVSRVLWPPGQLTTCLERGFHLSFIEPTHEPRRYGDEKLTTWSFVVRHVLRHSQF